MAGNGRFGITTSSPDSGLVGSRGKLFGPSLDKSGSFQEGGENKLFGNGPSNSQLSGIRIGNVTPLSQFLMLDPILMGDLKYTRSGELKRILGFSAGSCSEENSFGAAHSRPPPPVAFDELQHYKDSVIDSNTKAKFRAKKLDEHLHKLNKYAEVVNSKKQARTATSSNERPSTLNLKMGVQVHPDLPEVVPRRLEELAKNTATKKRVRTSMAETRADCRTNGVARQSLVITKDRDLHTDNNTSSDLVEEKVLRLPAGGEGWDKKMKRKRSASTSLTRPLDTDGERKRSMHHKVTSESGLQSGDALGFRSGHVNNISGTNKLDGGSLPANSLPRATQKHDLGKANIMKDFPTGLIKGKPLAKENNGLNVHEDNHITSPSLLPKLKASRTPRGKFRAPPNSILSSSPLMQNGEQPLSVNKSSPGGMSNIRKRALPAESSSPPMAQWVGQRLQKMSRTRRANIVSPVSNQEEGNITSEGCSPSDLSNKINSGATSGSHMSKGMSNGPQQFKSKRDNILSPAQISGGEESGACESVLKEKVKASDVVDGKADGSGQDCGLPLFVTKKDKLSRKEENSDGVRRQGRRGRGSFPMTTISPIGEKLDNAVTKEPLQTMRPDGENNRSKAGRPSKKQLDRSKGFSRRGPRSSSPDFLGDSDDDREELFTAAVSARNASDQACSSSFWKKIEPIFVPMCLLDPSCFLQQGDFGNEENSEYDGIMGGIEESNRRMQHQIEPNQSARIVEFADQFQEFNSFCGKLDSERILYKVAPLCQRVLSALVLEDEFEELDESYMEKIAFVQYTNDVACDSEPIEWDGIEYGYGSGFGAQSGNRIFPCNGTIKSNKSSNMLNHLQNGFFHSEVGVFVDHFDNDMDETQTLNQNGFTVSSFDSQYEKLGLEDKLLLELQSIGIRLSTVPDLDEGEDEALSQEIILLKQGLHNQVSRKKTFLERVVKSVQQEKEADTRKLEAIAMDKLVESAHRKLLATQGSMASKYGIGKVSKQVALSFSERTIARCNAFEEKGTSCFREPALRDALFAVCSLGNVVEAAAGVGVRLGSRLNNTEQHILHRGSVDAFDNYTYQSDEAFESGPIYNRGRKKEVLLDDVGGRSTSLGGGAKGKRSERERDGNTSKVGRPSLSNSRGERKPKAKPKQKLAQLATPGIGFVKNLSESNHQRREGGLISVDTIPTQGSLKEKQEEEEEEALDFSALPLPDLDTLDVLDVLGGNDDLGGLNSLLNFDDVGLLDHDSAGLETPMDELTELNMF